MFAVWVWFCLVFGLLSFVEEESSDSANVSDTEEYFEDFHLPMTHQNSMSTRRSFMRKIKAVDIRVPDAERIEGIVKSGQLNRHGSIRRKIVPQPQDFANDSVYSDHTDPSPVKFTSTPNATFADLELENDTIYMAEEQDDGSVLMSYSNVARGVGIEPEQQPTEPVPAVDGIPTELTPLDDATLMKIKDCLDSDKVRDIYTLGSTLQDLLSAAEIEEIISNSHRYDNVISRDILLALSESRTADGAELGKNEVASKPPESISKQGVGTNPDVIDTQDHSTH